MHREPKYSNVNEGRNLKNKTQVMYSKRKLLTIIFNRKTNIQVTFFLVF